MQATASSMLKLTIPKHALLFFNGKYVTDTSNNNRDFIVEESTQPTNFREVRMLILIGLLGDWEVAFVGGQRSADDRLRSQNCSSSELRVAGRHGRVEARAGRWLGLLCTRKGASA